jgi:hypothetical protein
MTFGPSIMAAEGRAEPLANPARARTKGDTVPFLRTAFTGSVALLLLLMPTASAAAQEAEATVTDTLEPYAPIAGQAWVARQDSGPNIVTSPTPPEEIATDYAWTLTLRTDDPRLSGTWATSQNYNHFTSDDVGGMTRHGIGRLTNEGGAWASEFRGFTKPGERWETGNHYMVWLTGEGGYEGLSAMLLMLPTGSGAWNVDGVIAPGPLPEPPTSLPNAE